MNNIYRSIQGNIGLGKAIEYFTSWGIPISIPLNDTQKYDLIADFDNKLQRISVKTSRYKKDNGTYPVLLKRCGGTQRNTILFDNNSCDYLFIYTADEKIYLIPSKEIKAINSIVVGNKYQEYLVKVQTLEDYTNTINNSEII